MGYQTGYQTGYEMYTLNNVYTTMYLNNVFKQCIETMLKDNSIFSNMQMLLFFLWLKVNYTVRISLCQLSQVYGLSVRTREEVML
jgi:hypothetical protein